ncbi:hypothetical protein KSP40_PGU001758 [Platanthera guangdongensis]|uniref:Uncharacterized protein n=1 Tax=Platanthera guangdongensis TaxID=2320717 RepID=A0ABR2M068_9ASPA
MGSPQIVAISTQELLSPSVRCVPCSKSTTTTVSPWASLAQALHGDKGCIPKQPDSLTAPRVAIGFRPNRALTLPGAPFQETWARSVAEDASPDYNSSCIATRFPCWTIPGSLSFTRGILVSFFSSTY